MSETSDPTKLRCSADEAWRRLSKLIDEGRCLMLSLKERYDKAIATGTWGSEFDFGSMLREANGFLGRVESALYDIFTGESEVLELACVDPGYGVALGNNDGRATRLLRDLRLRIEKLTDIRDRGLTTYASTSPGKGKAGPARRTAKRSKRAHRIGLTPKQEAVVELRDVHRLSFAEIARQWGCAQQAVQQLYERARNNPAYGQRSVNLKKASRLHANTRKKRDFSSRK